MTLSVINHKETKVLTTNGRKYWFNPKVSVILTSLGEVYHKKSELTLDMNDLVKSTPHINGNYSLYIDIKDKKKPWVASFNSLFARMVLGVSLRGKTLVKINKGGVHTPENLKIVSVSALRFGKSDYTQVDVVSVTTPTIEEKPQEESQTYLTEHTSESKFITEDFAEFPTLDLANWHQSNIDKGKANAEIVMKYNGGWACAEEVYLQSVSYRDGKPYEHFRYVMENGKGVQEVSGESTYSFNDVPYLGILGGVAKEELLQKRFKKEDADLLFDTIQSANVLVRKAVEVSKRGI